MLLEHASGKPKKQPLQIRMTTLKPMKPGAYLPRKTEHQ